MNGFDFLIFILFSVKILVNEASIVQIILLWIAELQLDKASANPGTFFFFFFCLFPILFRFNNKFHGFHYLNLSLYVIIYCVKNLLAHLSNNYFQIFTVIL